MRKSRRVFSWLGERKGKVEDFLFLASTVVNYKFVPGNLWVSGSVNLIFLIETVYHFVSWFTQLEMKEGFLSFEASPTKIDVRQ